MTPKQKLVDWQVDGVNKKVIDAEDHLNLAQLFLGMDSQQTLDALAELKKLENHKRVLSHKPSRDKKDV